MPEQSTGLHLEKAVGQTYTIHIPHRASKGEQVPLILLLHWAGQKYRWMGRGILEDLGLPAFSEMQAIIVAPDRKRRHWAVPQAAKDLTKLIGYLEEHYNLDDRKRAVVGFSLGGIGVWRLMLESPDLFPCGVPVSAPIPDHIEPTALKSPIYAIHSELDEHFPFEVNQDNANRLIEGGAPLELHTVPTAAHTEVRQFIPAVAESAAWMQKVWEQ